jgi:hypothetical protein
MFEKPIRWGWLIFGGLLTCSVLLFAFSSDWSKQSPLDLLDFGVSIVAIAGVLLYSFATQVPAPSFWNWVRWCFVIIAGLQAAVHGIEVAHHRGYSAPGTVFFLLFAALILGPIFYFQWVAMTRLAAEKAAN